jgi:telomerase reverse transcriptase
LRKRTELLHEFVYYVFDSILIPLIQSNFYVTESQVHRNRLFYFRHDVWRKLTEEPLTDIKTSMFEEIGREKANRILAKRSYSTLRLLPKAAGVRPITNLRRRTTSGTSYRLLPSINNLLAPVSNMLNCERKRQPNRLGSSVFSFNDMHSRVKRFKDQIMLKGDARTTRSTTSTRLYFVKLDIQSCFDTIPQSELIRVVGTLVSENQYHVTKHMEIRPNPECRRGALKNFSASADKLSKRFVTKAVSASGIIGTAQIIADGGIESIKRDAVIVDTSFAKNHRTDSLMALLEEHVRNNLVHIGKKYYRQRNGIPQGSVISSLLCNFFYAEMEEEVLDFLRDEQDLLLRFTDDFLLVTTRPENAQRFLQVMMVGQPKYGITVNPTKSLVNFEATVEGTKLPRLVDSSLFPYCGTLIDTQTLSVCKDRDHLYNAGRELAVSCRISDTLTTESSKAPGQAFHRKVLAFLRLQTQKLNLDTELNTTQVVLKGIYTGFLETAIKAYCYIKSVGARARPSTKLVVQIIRDSITYTVQATQAIHRKLRGRSIKTHNDRQQAIDETRTSYQVLQSERPVTRIEIEYLGAVAFRHVLQRKQTQFVYVLRSLDQMAKSSRPKNDREVIKLKRVIKGGNAMFDNWRY